MVTEFHRKFGHPVGESPRLLEEMRFHDRERWLGWECDEADEAQENEDLPESVDADIDRIYFLLGNLVEKGITPTCVEELIGEVHRANMDKIPNGLGKPIKPPGWRGPDIAGVLRRHGWTG
jgi:hypothetical protein